MINRFFDTPSHDHRTVSDDATRWVSDVLGQHTTVSADVTPMSGSPDGRGSCVGRPIST